MGHYFDLNRQEPLSVQSTYKSDRSEEEADLVGHSLILAALVLALIGALHFFSFPGEQEYSRVVEARQTSYSYPHVIPPVDQMTGEEFRQSR